MILNLLKSSNLFKQFSVVSQLKFVNKKCNFSSKSIGILGVPLEKGQCSVSLCMRLSLTAFKTDNKKNGSGLPTESKHGVNLAPDVLRNYGLIEDLREDLGLDVKDYGNVQLDYVSEEKSGTENGKLINPLEVGAACEKVSEAVKKVLLEGRKCVTLGGDHSLGIGTVHGHSLAHDTCVLWIDAHADINTPCTSRSGFIHGMPLAFLIEELEKYQDVTEGFEWLKPCIKKSNVAFIGLRDIDPLEKLILTKENILHFTMRDIDRFGIFEVTRQALKAINPTGKLSLHVSFDIDSIDTTFTPCTGTPVYGGLTIREALCIAEEICHLECFRGLDIVEVNPALGNKEQIERTLGTTMLVTKAFLGYSRHGMAPLNMKDIPVP